MKHFQLCISPCTAQRLEPEDFTGRSAGMYEFGELESNGNDRVALTPRIKVDQAFLEAIEYQLRTTAPDLESGGAYRACELISQYFWNELSERAQRCAVHCLRFLASLPGSFLTEVESTGLFAITAHVEAFV